MQAAWIDSTAKRLSCDTWISRLVPGSPTEGRFRSVK